MAAAVEAVRLAGPDFAVDDVARSAGRVEDGHLPLLHRQGRARRRRPGADLHRRSCCRGCSGRSRAEHPDDRAALRAVIAAFVALIEDEPELYRFAYAHAGRSGRADLVAATEHEIAEALAAVMAARLAEAGRPTERGPDLGLRRRRHGPAGRALVVDAPAPCPRPSWSSS